MSTGISYSAGGVLDEIKKINFPAHLFPRFTRSYNKGFRDFDIPAITGKYSVEYECVDDMELINVALACSGYSTKDFWEVYIVEPDSEEEYCLVETMPTRELAESINMGNVLYIVHRLPAGSKIRFDFNNESGTSKTVWPSLRFLR